MMSIRRMRGMVAASYCNILLFLFWVGPSQVFAFAFTQHVSTSINPRSSTSTKPSPPAGRCWRPTRRRFVGNSLRSPAFSSSGITSNTARRDAVKNTDDADGVTDYSASTSTPISTVDVLICGGGPTGLLASIMLAQKFPESQIQVHDRQPVPPDPTDDRVWGDTSKHYLIGLGGRGITSLETYGVWKDGVEPFCLSVPGRKDWTPETPDGKETIRTDRKYVTQVLPRDKLVSILHRHVVEHYANQIELVYESQVRPLEFEYSCSGDEEKSSKVLVEVAPVDLPDGEENSWKPILADLVVASDGSARTFANRMEELDQEEEREKKDAFRVIRFEDDNMRVYKTLPFRLPEKSWTITSKTPASIISGGVDGGEIFWNYAVQSEERRVIFDALPANDQGEYVGILLLRGDDAMAQPHVDPAVFRAFLETEIPQFISLLGDEAIAAAATSGPSSLPQFRYITPRMHQGPKTILLGDTAHTVKPYFGMGANSALEDVKIFGQCLDEYPSNVTAAIWKFSERRTPDIGVLVQTSRDLDRPGTLGLFTFLIPVILDGIFQKLAPQVFQPNIISLIQNEEYTFQDAVTRKQQDRVGQLLIVGGFLYSLAFAGSSIIAFILNAFFSSS